MNGAVTVPDDRSAAAPWLLRSDAASLAEAAGERALGVVDLDRWPRTAARAEPLPPVPLIGLGDAAHPLAPRLDAIVAPPVGLRAVVAGVGRAPHAAAVAAQLLRLIEDLPVPAALAAESLGYGLLQGGGEHARWLAARRPPPLPAGRLRVAREGAALRLAIDRPMARNAIDRALRDALHEAFALAAADPEIRLIALTATGPAFSVGADLAEFGTTLDPAEAHAIRARTLPVLPLARRHSHFAVHVQGACIGAGLEIAAFADRLTAAPDAWFQLPELAMGLIPGAGGCVSVARRIGRQRAALMILSGRRIGARTALAWGLIDAIEQRPPVDPGLAYGDGG